MQGWSDRLGKSDVNIKGPGSALYKTMCVLETLASKNDCKLYELLVYFVLYQHLIPPCVAHFAMKKVSPVSLWPMGP